MLEEDLTQGEKLYVKRRREIKSSVQAAAELGVSWKQYDAWTWDRVPYPGEIELGGIEPHEHYAVVRRRSGKTLRQIANEMGVGRETLRQEEIGLRPLKYLIEYWGT